LSVLGTDATGIRSLNPRVVGRSPRGLPAQDYNTGSPRESAVALPIAGRGGPAEVHVRMWPAVGVEGDVGDWCADGCLSGRGARFGSEEDVASSAASAQYSRHVPERSARGWFEADDLRRVLPFFSLAFGLVAAITQPSSAADIALTFVPVAAWSLWAFGRSVSLAAISVAIVVPVVVVQRSGQLEPVMFNVVLLAFAAARWSRSLAAAASLGLLAAATSVLVAVVQDPMEVATGKWSA
jgi:hypothetical protein